MSFSEGLRKARLKKGFTQAQLGEMIGVANTTISGYEKGTSEASEDKIRALMVVLDVDANTLFGWDGGIRANDDISLMGRRIGHAYEKATPPVQRTVEVALEPYMETSAEFAPELPEVEAEEEWEEEPIYNEPAAAGYGDYLSDNSYETMSFPAGTVPDRTDFGVRINGNSMEPLIEDGSIVWVQAVSAVEDGDIGIFVMDNCGYCKRLHIDSKRRRAYLRSQNDSYEDISIKEYNDFRTVGKVIGWIRPTDINC